jgi:hypothetical protein
MSGNSARLRVRNRLLSDRGLLTVSCWLQAVGSHHRLDQLDHLVMPRLDIVIK